MQQRWIMTCSTMLLLCGMHAPASAEDGMALVASQNNGSYADYIEGEIRRIDLQNGVVINTTASLGIGCWPRFSPDGTKFAYMDGTTLKICTVDGGAVRQFPVDDHGNVSWTTTGIWVSGDGRITKYDTLGTFIKRHTSGVVRRNYVSRNEITGSGVAESDWHPVIYNMRRNTSVRPTMPPGAWAIGCSACPSPDGTRVTNNLVDNTIEPANPSGVHRSMRILDTLGTMVMYLRLENITKFTQANYRWDTQCWSSNSNDWIVIPVGQGDMVADRNVSACIYNITTKEKYCLKDNSNTSNFWQPYDYYSGKLPGQNPALQLSPGTLDFAADTGTGNPPVKTVTVSTASGSLQGVTVSGQPTWLSTALSATTGTSLTLTNTVSIASLRAGTYKDTITVGSGNGGNKTYTVTLTIRSPQSSRILTSIDVSPSLFTVATGATVPFLATCRDQNGTIMTGQSVQWSASGGGTIANGLYTAGTSVGGAYRIVASATVGATTIRDTAYLDVSTRSATWRKIDCGSAATPATGWESDLSTATGGTAWTNPGAVSTAGVNAAAPAAVYKNVRTGANHSYAIAGLPLGMYTTRLHFSDAFDSVRSMSYSIQSVNVLRDFSIASAAGGANKALVMDFNTDLRTTGTLSINCQSSGSGTALEAGLEVMENRSTAITLLSPDGGEKLSVGQNVIVRWYADTIKLQQVYVELSLDDGVDYYLICASRGMKLTEDRAQWGAFSWVVPATVSDGVNPPVSTISSTCRVRIRPYFANGGVANAISNTAFAIQNGAGVRTSGKTGKITSFTSRQSIGTLHLSVTGGATHRLELIDVRGKLLYRQTGAGEREYRFSRAQIPAGSYVARLTSGGSVTNRQVVVE